MTVLQTVLGRKRVSKDKSDFYAADQLLNRIFDALILHMWDQYTVSERTNHHNNNNNNNSNDDTDANEDQQQLTRLQDFALTLNNNIIAASETIDDDTTLTIDQSSRLRADRNALLFLRDMLLYNELAASIKAGDIGRISLILQSIAILLQGYTKSPRYAIEILRLTYMLRYAWSDEWSKAVLSCMLVNPNGVKNGWIPSDKYQEHNNCYKGVDICLRDISIFFTFTEGSL